MSMTKTVSKTASMPHLKRKSEDVSASPRKWMLSPTAFMMQQ